MIRKFIVEGQTPWFLQGEERKKIIQTDLLGRRKICRQVRTQTDRQTDRQEGSGINRDRGRDRHKHRQTDRQEHKKRLIKSPLGAVLLS